MVLRPFFTYCGLAATSGRTVPIRRRDFLLRAQAREGPKSFSCPSCGLRVFVPVVPWERFLPGHHPLIDLYYLPKTSHPAQDEGEALNKTNEKIMLFISLLRERTTPDLYLSQVPFPIVKNLAQCLLVPETQIFVE